MQRQSNPEKLFRLAIHAAPAGIIIADESGSILFANQTMLDMFDYREQELLGQPVEILVPEKDMVMHRRSRERYSEHPTRRELGIGKNFEGQTKTGRRFPVEIGLRPGVTEEGQFVVATVIDITERKAIEDRLHRHEEHLEELIAERTQELREAQSDRERAMDSLFQAEKIAVIGRLVSGIGHEINNPLYVVVALAEAIESGDDISLSHEYSGQIIKHCRQIAETVKNVSTYAQPSDKHDLERVDLNDSITAAVKLARSSLYTHDVEIRQNTRSVPLILAKAEEIQQALFNIIRNSIQATSGRGLIEIESSQDHDQVSVRVRDSGTGIPEADQKKIFDPFFTTKGPDAGEGLGLYVVQQIVAKYQGTIDLESEIGIGTTFIVRFPAAV